MTIRNQSTDQIDEKIGDTAMAGMRDLRDILQLVIDGFDDRPLAQQQFLFQFHQPIFPILPNRYDAFQSTVIQFLKQFLGNVAFITKPPDAEEVNFLATPNSSDTFTITGHASSSDGANLGGGASTGVTC